MRRDDNDDPQAGLATYVAALTFNRVALPPNISEAAKRHIEDKAERERELAADVLGDTLRLSKSEREEEKAKDASARMANALEQQRQVEELEQWMQTPSTIGGVTMTGEEWKLLSERLRGDEAFQRRLMELFMARGMTEEEAQERIDRVADVAEIMAIPPSQRTEEQNEIVERAKTDPGFKQDARDAERLSADYNASSPEPASKLNQQFTDAASGAAVEARAEVIVPTAPTKVVTIDASPI